MSVFEWISEEVQSQFSNPSFESIEWKSKGGQKLEISKALLCAFSPLLRDFMQIEDIEIVAPEFDIETVINFSKLLHFGEVGLNAECMVNVKKLARELNIAMDLTEDTLENEESVQVNDEEFLENEEIFIPTEDPGDLLTYHCTVEGCTFHCFTHVALKKHVESIHQIAAFSCQICQKRFTHQSSLRQHLSIHKDNCKSFLCDVCGKGFRTKELCFSHRKIHGDRKLTCQICGAKFKQRTGLHQHKSIKHGLKKFQCLKCGKCFAKKQNLEFHERVHSGAAPYPCQICNVHFKRYHHYKVHLSTLKHLDQMSQWVNQGQRVPGHLDPALVLGLENANELAKQTCCDICPKNAEQRVTKFRSSYHFQKHIQSKSHMERILQCSQNGQSVGVHLIPANVQVS